MKLYFALVFCMVAHVFAHDGEDHGSGLPPAQDVTTQQTCTDNLKHFLTFIRLKNGHEHDAGTMKHTVEVTGCTASQFSYTFDGVTSTSPMVGLAQICTGADQKCYATSCNSGVLDITVYDGCCNGELGAATTQTCPITTASIASGSPTDTVSSTPSAASVLELSSFLLVLVSLL